jgi:hypothetical protein
MNPTPSKSLQRYKAGLRAHLKKGPRGSPDRARGLAAGLTPLDLITLHERTLLEEVLPNCPSGKRAGMIKGGRYFLCCCDYSRMERTRLRT